MLTQSEVDHLKMQPLPLAKSGNREGQPAPATFHCGSGLYMRINRSGGNSPADARGSWLFRYTHAGAARWLGLGKVSRLTYEDAQARLYRASLALADSIDPLLTKRSQRATAAAARGKLRTFGQCWDEFIKAGHLVGLAEKTRNGWLQHMQDYTLPVLAKLPVSTISTGDLRPVLEPHWYAQPKTARQIRMECERVLTFASVQGYVPKDAPNAAEIDRVNILLPAGAQATKPSKGHEYVPVSEMAALMGRLRAISGDVARCLEVLFLCAARKSEVAGMLWNEIDMVAGLITVPASRMKMKRGEPHLIPMSPRVRAILTAMPAGEPGDRVWPRSVSGNRVLLALLHKLTGQSTDGPDLHGSARVTFSTWSNDLDPTKSDVVEACLAHGEEDKVKGAYDKAQHLAARLELLTKYSEFCLS
jgi:integrase